MDPDILGGDPGDDTAPDAGEIGAESGAGAALMAAGACLACGAGVVGVYCAVCGQKNDDLRRSSFVLFRDFMRDTFGFDSRMWRTLGLLAAAPGLVPSNYAHGRRSRYTPPVRLFLVVSFLFFLTIGLTQTLFVGIEVTPKTEEQLMREAVAMERARAAGAEMPQEETAPIIMGEEPVTCKINLHVRYFIRAQDVKVDQAAWRECADKLMATAKVEIDVGQTPADGRAPGQQSFERILGGFSAAIQNPADFNGKVNAWLPRVMLLMTPVMAIFIAMFIRGRGALLFDHLVLSLYSHAVGFAVVGAAIIAGQFRAPYAGIAAMAAIGLYFIIALKRAYGRGWIKTILTAAFVSLFYITTLLAVVFAIVLNAVWRSGPV